MANPTLLTSPIAENGDKNVIPATTGATTGLFDQEHGFQQINELPLQAGGLPPQRKDFNGAFNLLSKILFYVQKGHVFDFDESQDYYAGCIVKDTDGGLYCANTAVSASSTHPKDDAVNWSRYNSFALRSHSYAIGDTSTLPNIPAGHFLECTTPGTTGVVAPVVPGPVSAGDTITDGTCEWTVRKCLPTSGGQMTKRNAMMRDVDNDALSFYGGRAGYYGANLNLFGATRTDSFAGVFELRAILDDVVNHSLIGKADGTLIWGSNDLGGSAILSKTLGGSGYVKRASGEIVQWGAVSLPANTSSAVITFPISFTSGAFRLVATSNCNGHPKTIDIDDTYNGGLTAQKLVIGNPDTHEGAIHWIAIGY